MFASVCIVFILIHVTHFKMDAETFVPFLTVCLLKQKKIISNDKRGRLIMFGQDLLMISNYNFSQYGAVETHTPQLHTTGTEHSGKKRWNPVVVDAELNRTDHRFKLRSPSHFNAGRDLHGSFGLAR